MNLVADVLATLEQLAPEAKTLLVAVSGGGDSVALLRLLAENSPHRLEVAHIDHALRESSADDARFVSELAETLALPYHGVRSGVAGIAEEKGWNLEDAARRLRYSFLTRTAKRIGADVIVTAHTQNDQAETVLMQLLRGAASATGIPARRGQIVRPLLGVSREQLRTYLATLQQAFLEDETNTDVARTRAWLRHEVLPLLARRYPAAQKKLAQFAELQYDQAATLRARAEPFFRDGGLELARLHREPAALQRSALAMLLQNAGLAPDLTHIETLRHSLGATAPSRISLPQDKEARVAYGRLDVVSRVALPPTDFSNLDVAKLRPELDPAKLAVFPALYFRTPAPGDRLRLSGGSKKVSDLLIDRKVSRERRGALSVLATNPVGPSEVLWLEGVAADVRVALRKADPDIRWMQLALTQAEQAAATGEVPVGAVVVRDQELLALAANTTRSELDPTAHAEVKAFRGAARVLGDWRLEACTLYVTLEPCPMCLGAALAAHLPRIVYGAANTRDGALGGVADLLEHSWKRGLEVRSGVLARDAQKLLQDFFAARRDEDRVTKPGR